MTILPSFAIFDKENSWFDPHKGAWIDYPIFAWTTAKAAARAIPNDEKGKNAIPKRYIPGTHYLPRKPEPDKTE